MGSHIENPHVVVSHIENPHVVVIRSKGGEARCWSEPMSWARAMDKWYELAKMFPEFTVRIEAHDASEN